MRAAVACVPNSAHQLACDRSGWAETSLCSSIVTKPLAVNPVVGAFMSARSFDEVMPEKR
jgi:hypothetical protein